jgi:cell division septum initiation protein DivIVA
MTTTDIQRGTAPVAAEEDVIAAGVDPPTSVDDEARSILARARYEAFRLMTDAREEAEEILAQARLEADAIRTDAEMQAESIVDAAHMRADEIRSVPASEGTQTAESVATLENEHRELTDRVGSLRLLADQLEERFAALAATANAPHPAIEETPRPVLDYSPSVPAPARSTVEATRTEGADTAAAPAEERGSFYSRRSAKLPRIGDAGGKNALDMMRTIRESYDDH